MSYIGNTPNQKTVLRVEARKSFSLGLRIREPNGRPVDLTDCWLGIYAKPPRSTEPSDDDNLFGGSTAAIIDDPTTGLARFDIQSSALDHPAGEYPLAIVLRTATDYSSVIVKGVLEILDNAEYGSAEIPFAQTQPQQLVDVVLRGSRVINVYVGSQLPPGMNYLRDSVLEIIENFDPDSVAIVPPGGASGQVLTKTAAGDYAMAWRAVGNGEFALDATGQPDGFTPVALGDDTWEWQEAGLRADDADPGQVPVADGSGGWEWAEAALEQPDWTAGPGDPGEILNKPVLGTAAGADVEDFISSGTLVSEMPGVHIVTEVPTVGIDGHLYFVYEE